MSKTPSLPTDPLAALLSYGGDQVSPGLIAQRIAQGQWQVDPAYTHEGLNLIELLAGNTALTDQAKGAMELVCALASAGVAIPENAWRRVDAFRHGSDGSKPVKLLLRGVGEGESLATMRDACRLMTLFRPIKPVVEQANKVLESVQAIGGWGRAIQGVSLATWLVCHDATFNEGGYTQSSGTDDEKQTWNRLRARVFGDAKKANGSWAPDTLELLLLDWNTCNKSETPGTTQSHAVNMETLLAGIAMAHPRIQALAAARMLSSLMTHACEPRKFSWEDPKPIASRVAGMHHNIVACMKRVLGGADVNHAAANPINFFLSVNPDLVRELPLNQPCIKLIINIFMEKAWAPGQDPGQIVQQWTSTDPAMLVHARQCAKEHLESKPKAAKEVRARMETFWLSLADGPVPAAGGRGLRL